MSSLKQILTVAILLFTFQGVFSQDEKKYSSKEEDAYYDSLRKTYVSKEFEPVSKEQAMKVPFDFIKLMEVQHPAIYMPGQIFSEHVDSMMKSTKQDVTDFKEFDRLLESMWNDKIGTIPRMSIIRQEKSGNKWGIVYVDSKYDDFVFGGWGYWIALSYDSGKTWNKYYTGLTENCYYFLKRNSGIPLWKDSTTFQIECVIVRQITEVAHPMPAEFEMIKDSLAILLDLSRITLDSDHDGLTDLVEEKMLLDPNNPDSDGDGIKDGEDYNPRFKSINSERSLIYETLIENFRPNRKGEMQVDVSNPPKIKKSKSDLNYGDFESVHILVADDKDLQGLELRKEKIIIMSTKEYELYKTKYPSHFIMCRYSQMFKCDLFPDTYKIISSEFTGGETYIVQKTKKGWKIFVSSSWIS